MSIGLIVFFVISASLLCYSIFLTSSSPMKKLAGKTQTLALEAAEEDVQRVWRSESAPIAPLYSFPNLNQFKQRFDEAEEYKPKAKIVVFKFAQEVHDRYNISFDDIKVCAFIPILLINGLKLSVYSSGRIKVGDDDEVIYDKEKLNIDNFEKFCLAEVA